MKPWDRQPEETTRAYAAFVQYLELGTRRSIAKLADATGTPSKRRWLGEWSTRYDWVARSRAYDDAIVAERLADQERGRKRTAAKIEEHRDAIISIWLALIMGKIVAVKGQMEALRLALDALGVGAGLGQRDPVADGLTLEMARRYLESKGVT